MPNDLFNDPQSIGILGMASGLLGASGPSRLPVSLGQAMGAGIQRGILDRGAAEEIATRKMLREAQARQMQQEQAQQEYLKTLFGQITDPQERLFAQLNPQAWVKAKLEGTAEPKPFGGAETGYHVLGPGGVARQVVPPAAKQPKLKLDEFNVGGKNWQKWWIDEQNGQRIRPEGEPYEKGPLATATATGGIEETAESKEIGKWRGEIYGKIQTAGMEANGKIARYDRLAQLLEGVETGKLTPAGTELASYLESVGIKIDPKLANKQAASTLSSELALQARNPSGGAGMPGAMSDQDRKYLNDMIPNLAKTPGGNRLIIETMKRLAQRDREVAKLAYDYRKKHKNLDGFEDELQAWADAHPLFADLPQGTAPQQSGLTPVEQQELDALRKKYRGR